MKKFGKSLYVASLAALVLASCSKEPGQNPSGPNGKIPVAFGSNIITEPMAAGRAENNNWNHLDSIGIYMLNSGKQLNEPGAIIEENANRHFQIRTEASNPTVGKINPFDDKNVIYYPLEEPVGKLKFMAYYPYTAKVNSDYTIDIDINNNVPLLTASIDDQDWYDYRLNQQPVPINMEFKHKMARIKIDITPGDGFSYADLGNVTVTYKNGNATGKFSLADDSFDEIVVGDGLFSIKRNIEEQTMTAYLAVIPNDSDMDGRLLVFEHKNSTGGGTTYPLEYAIPTNKHFIAATDYSYDAELSRTAVTIKEGEISEWIPQGSLEGDDQGPRPKPIMELINKSVDNPNTYIWPEGATELRIPVMKAYGMWLNGANGMKNSYDNSSVLDVSVVAEVIWADTTSIQYYTFEYDEPFEGAYLGEIVVTYDAVKGNAAGGGKQVPVSILVGLRDLTTQNSSGAATNMLWSWHIWVTDGDPTANWETRKNYNGAYTYYFMDRNLGARNAIVGSPGSKGLNYQLARKDPFMGTMDWNDNWDGATGMYQMINGVPTKRGTQDRGLVTRADDDKTRYSNPGGTVKNPVHWAEKKWWKSPLGDDEVRTIWGYAGSDKSQYDPCPEGWRVPGSVNEGGRDSKESPWYNPTINGNDNMKNIRDYNAAGRQDSEHGVIFDGTGAAAAGVDGNYALGYYPYAGYRNAEGDKDRFNQGSRLWISSGYFFDLHNDDIRAAGGSGDDDRMGLSIRCAKWEEGQH